MDRQRAHLHLMVLFFILLTVVFTVIGQLLVKSGMLEVGPSPANPALLPQFFWRTLTNLRVLLGLACAVVAALSWTIALSRANLSFAYPFTALGVVLVLALSGMIFHEQVPVTRWLGVLIVCVGIFVASYS